MDKNQILQQIEDTGIVAVLRTNRAEELAPITGALLEGGIKAIEITLTSPGALEIIKQLKEKFQDEIIIGAGSVIDPETARLCILQGAQFVVSPILNTSLIKLCKRYSTAVISGAFTPTEILAAWQAGSDVVKVFPATMVGPGYFKDVKGPLPQVKLTPTGGVNLDNAASFIRAGAAFVGVGSNLLDKEAVKKGHWHVLTQRAKQYIDQVKEARSLG